MKVASDGLTYHRITSINSEERNEKNKKLLKHWNLKKTKNRNQTESIGDTTHKRREPDWELFVFIQLFPWGFSTSEQMAGTDTESHCHLGLKMKRTECGIARVAENLGSQRGMAPNLCTNISQNIGRPLNRGLFG